MSANTSASCTASRLDETVTLKLEVWVKPRTPTGEPQKPGFQVTEAIFTYVAVDEAGKKRPVPDSARAAG